MVFVQLCAGSHWNPRVRIRCRGALAPSATPIPAFTEEVAFNQRTALRHFPATRPKCLPVRRQGTIFHWCRRGEASRLCPALKYGSAMAAGFELAHNQANARVKGRMNAPCCLNPCSICQAHHFPLGIFGWLTDLSQSDPPPSVGHFLYWHV